ncbi:uncharacterized protein M421DRAFT_364493 [Didymella exigua CBS 183.55]|uniref:Myosin class II heavy chain n=1 Tax=Didymella exigua CBS 183.55 TaxID=1150837 RepID=A0A6A5RXK2_9PLEO|nr:uncharacterized protein M421DRAFT_364493 [Didymella exigua CBS 183.55]KAF1931026.1 hypothetical protein M421DRAFT_364493 [Didymella exigua CBS 183.55]
MHARRTSESSPVLPSSPPAGAQHLGEALDPSEERSVVSPAQTLWTALSPTLTLANSSPELPTLSTLSALGRRPRTPSTVARNDRDRPDDTSFYTASWGSPYRHPPPVFNPQRLTSATLDSDDLEEGSSALQFGLEHLLPPRLEVEDDAPGRFNLEHLIPPVDPDGSPNQFTLENLIRSRLPRSITPTRESQAYSFTPRASDKNPTSEEWVRSFLEERWNREKNNWKSDISIDLDSSEESGQDHDFLLPGPPKRGHTANNKTLNQQDFWRHISKDQKEALGRMMSSKYADDPTSNPRQVSGSGPAASQFPPRTSSVRNLFASSISPRDVTPSHSPMPVEHTPNQPPTPVEPTRTPIPRTRKKVMVKGKGCIISIPHDIPRGTHGYPPKPMSPAAVQAKIEDLQRLGYNTSGFGHWNGVDAGDQQAHNRAIWPTEDDMRAERANPGLSFKVYVPKKSEWDNYVNSLVEAKLAALGVSLGGEDEAPAPMSRQVSGQYPGLPFSPPLPTPSGGSHRGRQGSVVTGPFPFGPSPGHMSRQSIASPAAFGNVRPSMHMHRHSTFGPGSFSHHGMSPSVSGTWSPGGYFGSQDGRGGSPALPALPPSRSDLAGMVSSPHSPFGRRASQQFPHSPLAQDDLMVQMQMQQQQLQAQMFQQQQQQLMGLRPNSTLAEVPEDESEEEVLPPLKNVTKPAPEIAHPTPRTHRHNLSENMEREAADAEYHLEEAIDKQFAEGGDFNTEPEVTAQRNGVANNTWEKSRPVLHQPQPHNRAHSITKSQQQVPFAFPAHQPHNPREDSNGARTNLSENTNPSLEDGEIRSNQHSQAPSQVSNPWKDSKFAYNSTTSTMHSNHASKSSLSKLNVEAKEFKFNPAASFNPGSSSNSKSSIDGLSSFNVTAPAFKPDAVAFQPTAPTFKPVADAPATKPAEPRNGMEAPEFKPAVPAFPSSGFSFSSPPAFKPDAPAFTPGGVSAFNPQKVEPAPASFSSKIFGDVNISACDIIKPATRSKAVAIVRPDTARESSPETVKDVEDREDAEGRPMQAEGREKRARKLRNDGDEVPKFALQPILASQPLAEPSPIFDEEDNLQDGPVEDKENRSPDGSKRKPKSSSPVRVHSIVETKKPTEKAETEPIVAPDTAKPVADPSKKHEHKTSSLSATAQPFEFKPQHGSAGYDFGFHVTKPSVVNDFLLQGSPPRNYSRSPATTYRPSDDGSFKTALGRVPYAESESVDFDPSFNDIDAVMKQMDEGGSDFGVERNDDSWEQSSPQRTPHEFDRFNLRPNVHLRSDAPSPSPRRIYANGPGSANSLQNPFDDERAALISTSPVHRLNHAGDLPVSDWDDILTEGEEQVKMRSSFFDKRVDDLMGRLLQNRLGPLEQTLRHVQHALTTMSSRPSRGRRSLSTAGLDSDADDEDDDIDVDAHYRNRSPRKDKRLEKIRAVVRDALESHQAQTASMPAIAPEPLGAEKIREILADVLVSHQPPAAPVEPVSTEQIRAIVEDAIASNKPAVPETVVEPLKPEDIRSMLTETLALFSPQPTEPIKPDDVRSIVMEAFATHAPQPTPAAEPLSPEAIRLIIAETLTTHQVPGPVPSIVEPMQPDTIRSIVTEALASQKASALEAPIDIPQPQFDISEIYQMIGSLKASIAQTTSNHLQADDVRELVDNAFKRQTMEVSKRDESEAIMKRDARIAELESMVEDSTLRHEAEEEARKRLEDREADTARLLKVTEEELTLLQAAAKDDEAKIRALLEERDVLRRNLNYQIEADDLREKLAVSEAENEELKMKNIALETSEEDYKQNLDVVTAENEALTFTLEEHRKSANKWRADIQEAHQENDKLKMTIEQSRYQAEEAARVRESMRGKFEKLQQDMVLASQQIAAERSQWQKNEQAHLEKYEVLSARIEAEGRTRERLERELERLEMQEGEGMKLRIHFEQSQKHNARLEETVEQLRRESVEHQNNAHRYERDMREAREAAHVEIRRTRVLMEADLDAANNQVNVVRHNLESEVARVRAELDSVRLEAETAREKHELELEAASDATKQAVEEAVQKSKRTLHEQQQAFERGFDRLKQEHARALEFAREDKQRAEAFHEDKLALADSKLDHFKDKIALLEEKLVVAKEAASAAVAAAAKSPTTTGPSTLGSHEKISPQALRESISVLQEQLQERESRIESLEQQLSDVDTEAPSKLKERDTEITWLRELLGVRVDDINDLINALAQPTFDRETVRDAAIRIRTNLQMEQSEKERLISGGQSNFPTLATLSNFASPKAVQVAAAFGNWRKGRQNAASALAGPSASSSRNQTPSRPTTNSAQSFLSGLMTPPTSNMRRTPDFPSSSRPKDLRSNSMQSTDSRSSTATEQGFPSLGKRTAAPSTPPLLRKASYDRDAAVEDYSDNGFDDDSTVDGGEVTPIALSFGNELRIRRDRD